MTLTACPHCGHSLADRPASLEVTFTLEGHRMHRYDRWCRLTHTEYLLVTALIEAGEVGVTSGPLAERLWPGQFDKGIDVDNRLKVYISRCRGKLRHLDLEIEHVRMGAYVIVEAGA